MKKILILAANPSDTVRLRLDKELRDIEDGLNRAKGRDDFRLVSKSAVRPGDIQRALLDEAPQIIHFSGHGEGEAGLVFEDDTGRARCVSTEALAGLFDLFSDSIECVLLNGCYSKVQAESIFKHINCVIGMSQAIGDRAAIAFAVSFYDALGAGRPYEFAYRLACNSIQLHATPQNQVSARAMIPVGTPANPPAEDLTPVLLIRPSQSSASPESTQSKHTEDKKADLEANFHAVKAAGEARLETLNQRLADEESELQEAAEVHIKETTNWIKTHSSGLSYDARKHVTDQYADFFKELSDYEKEDFQWEIETYIESVHFSMLSGSYELLEEPAIRPSISLFEAYQSAFEYIKNRIPQRVDYEARDAVFKRFDYLLKVLSRISFS